MINYKQHEIFKQLSASVYRVNTNDFSDWEEINTVNNYLTGFRAKIRCRPKKKLTKESVSAN